MSAWDFYQKGGVMTMIITLLSVYVLAVIFYKTWQLLHTKALQTRSVKAAMVELKAGKVDEVTAQLQGQTAPLPVLLATVLECRRNPHMDDKQCEAEITRVGAAELARVERHLRGLEMAAGIAPLLGLLGTVIGLIDSFSKLGASGSRVDPAMLAGGIWEALIATAAGLAVAITAFAAHHVFDTLVDGLRATMQDVATQALNMPLSGAPVKASDKPAVKLIAPKYVQ